MKPILFAMSGPIGSGKTTFAKGIAQEMNAVFISIDQYVKLLGQPIESAQDYDKYYFGIRAIIADVAYKILRSGRSVVLDFGGTKGHWDWLKPLADRANVDIEIYNLLVPIQVRRERVQQRNLDPQSIFKFSDEAFDSMPVESIPPDNHPGLNVINVNN